MGMKIKGDSYPERLSYFVGTPERLPLREKCPDTELFLVRIFLYSD